MLALGVGGYAAARTTAAFDVTSIEVRGAPAPVAADVRDALGPLVGTSLLDVSSTDVGGRLEALPFVASANYDRAFPHTLVVVVRPERPVAILRRGRDSWLLAESGRALESVSRGARARLPRIWVPASVDVTIGSVVSGSAAARAARALRPVSSTTFPARISTVRAGEDELTFLLASGLEIRLSDETNLPLKLGVASQIVPLLPAHLLGGPAYLDLSVPERPVAGTTLDSQLEVDG